MKPEIKKAWVEALRSGKYKQGQQALSTHGHHCCLGVLLEILPPFLPWPLKKTGHPGTASWSYPNCSPMTSSLDTFLLNEIGLPNNEQVELIRMNDTLAMNFEGIALLIEANL
jgi:hypothetical protein